MRRRTGQFLPARANHTDPIKPPKAYSPMTTELDLAAIRTRQPLVLNITNYVVMNTTANALLALGASPVMAHAREEVADMVALAQSLVLNIGTLSPPWIEAMRLAGLAAREKGIPVVLDPVGCGATPFRTETARALVAEVRPQVIRGNASEIRALLAAAGATKGVDSMHTPDDVLGDACQLSRDTGAVVSVSGPVDLVTDGHQVLRISNGHPMATRVTGMGCTATAVTGAFLAVCPSTLDAAAHAMALMGVAGELAAELSAGPGSFQMHFLDVLYRLDPGILATRTNINSMPAPSLS